jgi:hypothetical protein
MKTIFPSSLLFVLFLVVHSAIAQPTITSANMYAAGDILIMQNADTVGVDEGPSGANQTWDFSSLNNQGSATAQNVLLASGTPYFSSFPAADLATDVGGGNYSYLDIAGGDLLQLGFGSTDLTIAYTDPQKYLAFPFTYNTSFSDNIAGSYEVSGLVTTRTGTVSFLADGYGTLILPTGTYNNVLRVKYVQNIADVISIGPVDITTTTITSTYFWMVPGNKNSLMNISHITVSSTGSTVHANNVFYYPGVVSTEDFEIGMVKMQLIPNPAEKQVFLNAYVKEPGSRKVSVVNVLGQTVKTVESADLAAGVYQGKIELDELPDGLYFVQLATNDRIVASERLIKQ